jgi:hypothetical protein
VLPSAETVSFVLSGLNTKDGEKKGTRTNERGQRGNLEVKKRNIRTGYNGTRRSSRNMTSSCTLLSVAII